MTNLQETDSRGSEVASVVRIDFSDRLEGDVQLGNDSIGLKPRI